MKTEADSHLSRVRRIEADLDPAPALTAALLN
jgi:hypothetical protein